MRSQHYGESVGFGRFLMHVLIPTRRGRLHRLPEKKKLKKLNTQNEADEINDRPLPDTQ